MVASAPQQQYITRDCSSSIYSNKAEVTVEILVVDVDEFLDIRTCSPCLWIIGPSVDQPNRNHVGRFSSTPLEFAHSCTCRHSPVSVTGGDETRPALGSGSRSCLGTAPWPAVAEEVTVLRRSGPYVGMPQRRNHTTSLAQNRILEHFFRKAENATVPSCGGQLPSGRCP